MTLGPINGKLARTIESVVRELRRQGLNTWVLSAEHVETSSTSRDTVEDNTRDQVALDIFDDGSRGRGVGRASSSLAGLEVQQLVEDALSRARLAVGPPWSTPPSAGPARVMLADPALTDGALADLGQAMMDEVLAVVPQGNSQIVVERGQYGIMTSGGQSIGFSATMATMTVQLVGTSGILTPVVARARQRDSLNVTERLQRAVSQQRATEQAERLAPGSYTVVLRAEAMANAVGELGPWQLLVAQADAAMARAGLVAYAMGDEVAAGASSVAEPLNVTSDGAYPLGLSSSPVGPLGEAVRRFPLVVNGRAAGLGLDLREAALRNVDANGGVRELVITGGSDDALSSDDSLLEVHAATWLEVDTGSGFVLASIDLARLNGRWVRGGLLRGDGFAWLALGKRSRTVVSVGRYHGPKTLTIGVVDVLT